jgi:hypothetical protein
MSNQQHLELVLAFAIDQQACGDLAGAQLSLSSRSGGGTKVGILGREGGGVPVFLGRGALAIGLGGIDEE